MEEIRLQGTFYSMSSIWQRRLLQSLSSLLQMNHHTILPVHMMEVTFAKISFCILHIHVWFVNLIVREERQKG